LELLTGLPLYTN